MSTANVELKGSQPTILSFVKDLPNVCSLAGLACTILSIYFSILGVYHIAMIGMVWAVAFDWTDGLIARRMKARTGDESTFGGQLDVLIDIVSYGVAPGRSFVELWKIRANFSGWCLSNARSGCDTIELFQYIRSC